jgi:hypothetical protein
MRTVRLAIAAVIIAGPVLATTQAAQSFPGVTVLQHPGGGTIAYAQMPAQHTVQGAIGRVFQYVQATFGGKPQVSHVMKSSDGNSLAVTFTVKSTTQGQPDMAGLALVAVSANGPGKGAVLSDRADRFGTTVGDMLNQMRVAAGGPPASGPTAGSAATPAPSSAAATAPANAVPAGPPPSAAAAAVVASAKSTPQLPATVHTTAFPDGSGSIGLPDGWKITAAHAGNVMAQGPSGEKLHFDAQFVAYDPSTQSKFMRPLAGQFSIAYSADLVTKFKLLTMQAAQQQHAPPPSITILDSQSLSAQSALIVASVSDAGAVSVQWSQLSVSPLTSGIYTITLYQVTMPQQIATQNSNVVGAIFHSYSANAQVAQGELKADYDRDTSAANAQMGVNRRAFMASEQTFAADDNALLGNTVVRDRDFNEHGVVSDNLADALVQADPNRFQEVPANQYVPGVDFTP